MFCCRLHHSLVYSLIIYFLLVWWEFTMAIQCDGPRCKTLKSCLFLYNSFYWMHLLCVHCTLLQSCFVITGVFQCFQIMLRHFVVYIWLLCGNTVFSELDACHIAFCSNLQFGNQNSSLCRAKNMMWLKIKMFKLVSNDSTTDYEKWTIYISFLRDIMSISRKTSSS
jgi:hypothetical protein